MINAVLRLHCLIACPQFWVKWRRLCCLACYIFNLRMLLQNLNDPYNEDLKFCDKKATKHIYKIDLYSEIIHQYPWQQLHVTATKEKLPHQQRRVQYLAMSKLWYVLGFFKISADINTLSVRSSKKKTSLKQRWNEMWMKYW